MPHQNSRAIKEVRCSGCAIFFRDDEPFTTLRSFSTTRCWVWMGTERCRVRPCWLYTPTVVSISSPAVVAFAVCPRQNRNGRREIVLRVTCCLFCCPFLHRNR